jgi:hypothetical protein
VLNLLTLVINQNIQQGCLHVDDSSPVKIRRQLQNGNFSGQHTPLSRNVSVKRHVSYPLDRGFSIIAYYHIDKIRFKQHILCSSTERFTQGAHMLPHTGQRHSVHNECEDHVYFFVQYIFTNISVAVVKYNFHISLLDIPHY